MAGQARALKRRIKTIRNTRKITRTMELVSASKLRRATDRMVAARPYAKALREVIGDLASPELEERFPLLRRPAPPSQGGPSRFALILVTSNRGLCGAFNSNIIKEARRRRAELEAQGYAVDLMVVGKKAISFFRYGRQKVALERPDIGDRPTADHAAELGDPLIKAFAAGELGGVEVVGAQFKSALSTPPGLTRVLPVDPPAASTSRPDYILRPNAEDLLEQILPLYVRNAIYRVLVETAAAEHGARRTAMKSATDNAGDLLKLLERTMNRQRQAQITQEIAEIVGGAAALAG